MISALEITIHTIQYAGFIGAQITNATLLILLITRAEKLFGTYRHVMGVFAFYSLLYTWIEMIVQPIMHIKGSMFIVMMDGPIEFSVPVGNYLSVFYCGSSALCISLLGAQFYYRYNAICKPETLHELKGCRLFIIFIPCLVVCALWNLLVFYGMANTKEKQEFMRDVMLTYYNKDLTQKSFIGPMYYSYNEKGERQWRLLDVGSSAGCTVIIGTCFSTIMFCALKMYWKLKDAQNIMSAKTKELNRQLFVTLTLQTVLPFAMMYSPVGLILTLPFFEIEVGRMANFCGASAGAYPAIEPLIAIFFIRDFRQTVLCQKGRRTAGVKTFSQFSETRGSDVPSTSFQ